MAESNDHYWMNVGDTVWSPKDKAAGKVTYVNRLDHSIGVEIGGKVVICAPDEVLAKAPKAGPVVR